MSGGTICGNCGSQLREDGCDCPPPSLEQRAIAAGLRWHGVELTDFWGTIGTVWQTDWRGMWYAALDGGRIGEGYATRREAQEAVLAAWAERQDKEVTNASR